MATVTIIPPRIQSETGIRLRVAAYCRVSSSSDDQLNSYMAQMTYYSHKFDGSETEILTDIYADEGITGTRDDKRTEFQRMIRDCRKGKIDRIYTKSISRFARNTKDCLEYLRELKSLGISVFFEKENIDTARTSDEMMITILGGLAQEESVSISQNMRWSIQKRMQNGTFKPTHVPYGYEWVNSTVVINDSRAAIVRRIFCEYLQGNSPAAICQRLNTEGIPAVQENDIWRKRTIRYILSNEKYIGDCLWRKRYTTEAFPFQIIKNRGEKEQYYVKGTHPPIIDTVTFEAAQKLLAQRTAKYGITEFEAYPLSCKIRCGHCGCLYKRKPIRTQIRWVCYQHDLNRQSCPNMPLTEHQIYDTFVQLHNRILAHRGDIIQPTLHLLQMLNARRNSGNADLVSIHQEIAKLREQSHVLASLRTKGFLNEAKYQEQLADLNRKIEKQQKQIHLFSQHDEDDEALRQLEQLADYFESRNGQMIVFEPESFELLVEHITVHGRESLDFHLIGGLTLSESLR